jgi:hypothetical protein
MTSRKPLALCARSFVPGSPERTQAEQDAALTQASIWVSLDPIGHHSPPPGILWLRLGERRLKHPGWRQSLSIISKVAPAMHALGARRLLCLDETGSIQPVFSAIVQQLARTSLLAGLPIRLLRLISPSRAKQLASQREDWDGQLHQLFDVGHYLGCHPPSSTEVSPLSHYLAAGQYAGLNPHPLFWSDYYATQFAGGFDGLAPWRHFAESGGNPNPFFVTRWYTRQPGAGRHHSNPLLDMLAHHRAGDLPPDPNPLFDQAWYVSHHDCRGMLPLSHFLLNNASLPTCAFLARHPEIAPMNNSGGTYLPAFLRQFASRPSSVPTAQAPSTVSRHVHRIAVCCVVSGNYDIPQPLSHRMPQADYFLLCDQPPNSPLDGWSLIQVEPIAGKSAQYFSRYLKMNLLSHIPMAENYDAIVYIDANITMLEDIAPIISAFLASTADLGVIPHPFRQSVYEEAATIMLHMRESREQVYKVLEMLEREACPPTAGLFEMNFFSLRPGLAADQFLKDWWAAFQQYGNRDQLLAPLIAWKNGTKLHALLPAGQSVRNHPAFQYYPH